MFKNCSSLTTLDVRAWDVSSVVYMAYMFYNCSSLITLDVSYWDVSSVEQLQYAFNNCSSLITLDVSSWDVSSVVYMEGFATGVTIPTVTYDATLIAWAAQTVQSGVTVDFGLSKYTAGGAAETARTYLDDTKTWTIQDGGAA